MAHAAPNKFFYVEVELKDGGKFAGMVICSTFKQLEERLNVNFGAENIASYRKLHITKDAYNISWSWAKAYDYSVELTREERSARASETFFGR